MDPFFHIKRISGAGEWLFFTKGAQNLSIGALMGAQVVGPLPRRGHDSCKTKRASSSSMV